MELTQLLRVYEIKSQERITESDPEPTDSVPLDLTVQVKVCFSYLRYLGEESVTCKEEYGGKEKQGMDILSMKRIFNHFG